MPSDRVPPEITATADLRRNHLDDGPVDPDQAPRQCTPGGQTPVIASARDLTRALTLIDAQARAARFFLPEHPAAAIRALRDVGAHTGAVLDAVRTPTYQRSSGLGLPAAQATIAPPGVRGGLIALRSAGGTFRFAVTGDEHHLGPHADAAVAGVIQRCLHEAAHPTPAGTVSLSMTWSPHRLHVLVVVTTEAYQTAAAAGPVSAVWSAEAGLITDLGGSFRVHRQTGSTIVAITLPASEVGQDAHPSREATTSSSPPRR